MNAYDIDIALNLARLIVADCDEELSRVHSDEAEAEVETIECVKFKTTKIITCLKSASNERDTLLTALRWIATEGHPNGCATACGDVARAALAGTPLERSQT